MNRLHIVLLLLAGMLAATNVAQAQFARPVTAWGLTLETVPSRDSLPASHEGLLTLDVPLRDWLPQTTPDSRMRLAAIGARWTPDAVDGPVRIRLTIMDLELQRASWSGSVRLLDLNASRLLATQHVWLEAGTGPGFHAVRDQWTVSGRLQVFGGGSRVDSGVPGTDGRQESAWYAGARSSLSARFTEHFLLVLKSQYATYTGSVPSWWSGNVRLEYRPSRKLTVALMQEQLEPSKGRTAGFRGERARTVLSASVRIN